MKPLLLITGFLLLLAVEILRIYFIMPMPGSQYADTINWAYWLHKNIIWLRILGLLMIAWPVIQIFRQHRLWKKIAIALVLVLYGVVLYFFNFVFQADKMFYQPTVKKFANSQTNIIPADKLIIGLAINGEARAYPVQLIGYHHQVRDSVGGKPVMVTYCTVCRTGRVFSPLVNGANENFRLVGMDHFNAMFEDATTKSWWRQATGIAITGPLKGTQLTELPSQQSTLAAWFQRYPSSLVLQPDTIFNEEYLGLKWFDNGTIKSTLEKRDSASWQFKSWVVGISHGKVSKAYDWNHLVNHQLLQDSLPGLPLLLTIESDTATFHAFHRQLQEQYLQFVLEKDSGVLKDLQTQSSWNKQGICIDGPLKGQQLQPVQAYQEFWHSWQTFHPRTLRYL